MTHRFLTHFSTVFFIHAVVIFGGLTLLRNEEVSRNIGQTIINLKVAGEALLKKPQVKTANKPVLNRPSSVTSETKPGDIPAVTETALSGTAIADIKSLYKAQLRSRIEENKFYPMAARRMGQTGTVIVAFTLLEDGSIIDVRLETPSPFAHLNDSALKAVKDVHKFRPIPKELGQTQMDLKIPIKFLTVY